MISLSPLDQERFGIAIARCDHVTPANIEETLEFCRAERVRMLIARCPISEIGTAQKLEAEGGRLMDTLIHYERALSPDVTLEHACEVAIRPFRPSDEDAVRTIAQESFRGYAGHYHADPRLDPALVAEIYPSWAVRSCRSSDVADQVLVADDGDVAGFATLRMNDRHRGEGVLFAVGERARGRGIYRAFMVEGMRWCIGRGADRMVVSTQLTNGVVQNVWIGLGFTPTSAFYTFHVWFSRDSHDSA